MLSITLRGVVCIIRDMPQVIQHHRDLNRPKGVNVELRIILSLEFFFYIEHF